MNIWDPFHPVAYFLHATLGVAGIFGAIIALAALKGSTRHVLAGRIFATAAAIAAATAIGFSLTSFAPMAIASAVLMLSVVGSAILAHRHKSTGVTFGEYATAGLMAFVLLWLLYGVTVAVQQGGYLWIPPLILAAISAAFLVNDIRYIRLSDAGRESMRLPRHLSRMAFAFALAIHEPIVVFSDDLGIHPSLAFYGPFIIWPMLVLIFNSRIKSGSLSIENG